MSQPAVQLTTLRASDRAEIVRIDGGETSQLSGFGFYPGIIIQIHQRFPSYIVRTDQTEIALETDVASKIWVKKIPETPGRRRR